MNSEAGATRLFLAATGAWKSVNLNIQGADLKNVLQALPFLKEAKLGHRKTLAGAVAVIGGGNVAVDAARTALRLGADKVVMACLESRDQMPAFEWEIETAEQEGLEIMNSVSPRAFAARPGGNRVGRIDFQPVTRFSRNADGNISWDVDDGAEARTSLNVNFVIVAIGQAPDTSALEGITRNEKGGLVVDPETMATNVPDLFAAGDAVKAPGTVTEAIAAGHVAAVSIDRFLNGQDLKVEPQEVEVFQMEEDAIPPFLVVKDRWDMPRLTPKDALRCLSETHLGYTEEQVMEEAKRCLNCRMCGNCLFGRGQICFETSSRLLRL